jgi:putative ABC transport system permease protein
MAMRTLLTKTGSSLGMLVMWALQAVAFLLSGFRLGRTMRSVSIPRMQAHPVRTSLTVLGVAVGVALLVGIATVNESILRGVAATVEDISGKADLQVAAGGSGFDEGVIERVSAVPGVAKRCLAVQQVTTLQDAHAQGERLLVLGIDMLDRQDEYFHTYRSKELDEIREDPLPFLNAPDHVLLSRSLADRLGYKLGDRIKVATATVNRDLVIRGFLDEEGVGHAFGGAVAVMYYQALQILFGRDRNIDRIDLAVKPGTQVSLVKQRIQALLGEGFTVDEPATKGERIGDMLRSIQSSLTMASLIALLVATFLIHNTISISIVQRKRELAVLRALGTRRRELLRLLTLEGATLGITGSLLGVALGMGIARGLLLAISEALSEIYLQVAATEVHWNPSVLLGSLATGVLLASAAAAAAARRSGHIKPAEALRTAGIVLTAPVKLRLNGRDLLALGLVAAAGALLWLAAREAREPLALGAIACMLTAGVLALPRLILILASLSAPARFTSIELRLAQGNLPRDIGRTSGTAAALMVGVAMAVSFATFANGFTTSLRSWVEQTLQGDLFITNAATLAGLSSREVPMEDTLYDALRVLPGVESIRRVSIVETPFRSQSVKLVSTDSQDFQRYVTMRTTEGTVDEALRGWAAGQVTISGNFSQRFDVHRGDAISLSTRSGTRSFKVAAVVEDYTSDRGTIGMDRRTYIDAFGDTRVGTYMVHLGSGGDPEKLRRAINQRYGSTHNLFVLTNQELRQHVMGRVDQVFALLRGVEMVALVVAMLGIINALLANILDRIREVGVLRAVGMLRRQVSKVVLFEAVLIGLAGSMAGMCVGLALGYIQLGYINVAITGWQIPFRIPWSSCLELIVLTLGASALAGFYPARQAAATKITSALEYE